jgi:hypothetical protein
MARMKASSVFRNTLLLLLASCGGSGTRSGAGDASASGGTGIANVGGAASGGVSGAAGFMGGAMTGLSGGVSGGGGAGASPTSQGGSGGCSSSSPASRPTGGKIGDWITTDIVSIGISVQRDEPVSSMGGPWDRWMVEFASRAVTLNNKAAVTASEAQVQALVTLVRGLDYRFRDICCGGITMHVDGPPNPPQLTVNGKDSLSLGCRVGDTDYCADSSLEATGIVIHCAAFAPVYDLFEEMYPSGGKFTCSKRW